jgi:flagellar biogenesis protein FliO
VGSTLLAFGRMILVLGFIVGLLLAMAHFVRKRQLGPKSATGGRPTGRIEILSRRSVGRHVSLMVIRAAGRTFLVGQSAQQMTLLSELDGDEWVAGPPGSAWNAKTAASGMNLLRGPGTVPDARSSTPGAWDALMDHLREMTVRR